MRRINIPSWWLRDNEQTEPAQPPVLIVILPASQNGNICISPTSTLAPAAMEARIAVRPRTSQPHSSTSMAPIQPADGFCGIYSFFLINHYSYLGYLVYDERPHLLLGYLNMKPVFASLPQVELSTSLFGKNKQVETKGITLRNLLPPYTTRCLSCILLGSSLFRPL